MINETPNDEAAASESPPSNEQAAEVLYGRGGEVPASYKDAIDGVFNAIDYEARYEKDTEMIESLAQDRKDVEAVLQEFQVADPVAREVLSLANRYIDLEIGTVAMKARGEMAMNELRERYGDQTDKYVHGACRVVREMAKKIPWLISVLECGGGNDPKVIAHFVTIAKQRGWA